MFYEYPFQVGYSLSLSLPSLAEQFYRYYGICLAQLSPYIYKLFLMLIKFVELAGCEISIRHLLHLFAPRFQRGTMIHLRHHGTKGLVAGIDYEANHRFWFNFFFTKTVHVVASPSGFPEQWNFARKCFC